MFTHLHCHSHYSLLDGLSKIDPLVERAKELGMTSLALTDHGTMYGIVEFFNKCTDAGIKCIVGMEAYIAPRSRFDKEGKGDADYFHITLLAENFEGYQNLMSLSTLGFTEGFYYKPRLDKEILKKYAKGIIALSGCPRGPINRALKQSEAEAEKTLKEYLEIFGENNFFLELQRNTNGNTEEQEKSIKQNLELSKKFNVPVVATQDCHYIYPEDAEAQDVLVCIGTGRNVADTDRLNMSDHDLSLRSPEMMTKIFHDIPQAILNTEKIAERCNVTIPINQRYFAQVELPEGMTPETELKKQIAEKSLEMYGKDGVIPKEVQDRIDYEMDVICQKGFAVYFLMVADIVKGAHEIGALTNTRGSAAGSIIGHILNISSIDPLYYQLPFERFLTVFRPTPPDVDLDISDKRRDEAIAWITERYGHDKVAQIITFGTMMARAVVRDVGRALGVAYGKCDRIAKMIPIGKQGFQMTLDKALEMNAELKEVYKSDAETKRVIDIAKKLEGCARHASIHAAAIAITPTPLTDYTPLQKEPDGDRLITQYDMYALDVGADSHAIGVIKMDLLGIRNLSILEEAVNLVESRHNIKINLEKLPHPDPKTFKLLSDGLTFGVFQLGSSGMTRHLKELKPTTIFDIMAMIALYRPGPMSIIPEYIERKQNPNLVKYFLPKMKDYLERSLGMIVYQDDVLLTSIYIAGYNWEEADKLRKAMGKKIPEEMAKQKVKFIDGCIKNGLTTDQASELFKLIEPFAAYGFNKSHAASYSQVSYQTAYMKANYPVEFMAAVMTAESGDEEKIYAAVEECEHLGIKVLPPDVNESFGSFTVVDEHTIRFGLDGVKNLGSDVVTNIIKIRTDRIKNSDSSSHPFQGGVDDRRGGFASLEDFLTSCYTKNLNKKSYEALVKCGALDRFGERGQLLANTEYVLEFLRDQFKAQTSGQDSLFGNSKQLSSLKLKPASPATEEEILTWEKEHLGLYVSAHPLHRFKKVLKSVAKISEIYEDMSERTVTIGGIISKLKRTLTKKNDPMAFFTLQDMGNNLEVLVFPKTMVKVSNFLKVDNIIQVTGKVSDKDGEPKLIADDIKELPSDELYEMALGEMEKDKQVVIYLNDTKNQDTLQKIKDILIKNPGNALVILNIGSGNNSQRIKTQTTIRISDEVISALKQIPEVAQIAQN
jgi:DNA polymerase-3 subunit alpha